MTPVALKAIDQALTEFMKGVPGDPATPKYTVSAAAQEARQFDSVEAVLALRNPKASPIVSVMVVVAASGRGGFVLFDADGQRERGGIVAEVVADTPDHIAKLADHLAAESRNLATWFSPIRRSVDGALAIVGRVPGWVRVVAVITFACAFALLIVNIVIQAAHRASWRRTASELLAQVEAAVKAGEKLDEQTIERVTTIRQAFDHNPVVPLASWMVSLVGGAIIGWAVPRVFAHLFPRMEFAIGDGVQRHDRLRATRNFALGTIVVSGVVLPLVRAWAFR